MSNKYCSDECSVFIPRKFLAEMQDKLIEVSRDFNQGNTKRDFTDLKSICGLFDWSISFDSEGNITSILAYDELSWGMSCRERFVEVIAPFVKSGGFVEMHGEDGDVFRILFKEFKTREVRSSVSWED